MSTQLDFKRIESARKHLRDVRKDIADMSFLRQHEIKASPENNENLILMEQGIDRMISNLELEIILYRRFIEDTQT